MVDASEFVSGAVVLCGGDRDSKIKLSFEILDADSNGVLDFDEIKQYMSSVFRVVANSSPESFVGSSPEQLAEATAKSAMEYSRRGVLTFEQVCCVSCYCFWTGALCQKK
jgi:Ca2+-binding EF-hand superfamily protein